MRKSRRKIQRKVRKESGKSKRRKNWLVKHLDSPVTNRFTKVHSYLILIVEILFCSICGFWAYYEIFIRG